MASGYNDLGRSAQCLRRNKMQKTKFLRFSGDGRYLYHGFKKDIGDSEPKCVMDITVWDVDRKECIHRDNIRDPVSNRHTNKYRN